LRQALSQFEIKPGDRRWRKAHIPTILKVGVWNPDTKPLVLKYFEKRLNQTGGGLEPHNWFFTKIKKLVANDSSAVLSSVLTESPVLFVLFEYI